MPQAFHETALPEGLALGARGGPERITDIVLMNSGREERNARHAHARRRWDIGYGIKSVTQLATVVAFFEERRGKLYGFRFRDRLDHRSSAPGAAVTPTDQPIGTGNGTNRVFKLVKRYGAAFAPYDRPIEKPVAGTVRVAVAGTETTAFTLDTTTGTVTFNVGAAPAAGAAVTAGYRFEVPVRFDTDRLDIDLAAFEAGAIPSIPIIEIRP